MGYRRAVRGLSVGPSPHGIPIGIPQIYIIYILSFATALSDAFASDFVLNVGWDSGRLRFPGFELAFSAAFLEGPARRALTGVLLCARLGVSVSDSRATDERGVPELEGYLLGRGDTEVPFASVQEICFEVVLKGPRVARVDSSRVLRI